jgi:hypothetical protein
MTVDPPLSVLEDHRRTASMGGSGSQDASDAAQDASGGSQGASDGPQDASSDTSPARKWRCRPLLGAFALLCALGLGACANTLQDQPVTPSFLEPLIAQEGLPVYWLGGVFQWMGITRVSRDPSGAYEIQYGNCILGGQNACATPVQIVTSPDNSFLPGGTAPQRPVLVRGVHGLSSQGGNTIVVPTGGVVVDLYADSPALARAAAEAMVRIASPDLPGAPLPRPLPNTGYGEKPLPSQQPPLAPAGWAAALRGGPAHS